MNRRRAVKLFCGLVAVALFVPALTHDDRAAADDRAGAKAEVRKGQAKSRGRLPVYFSAVVSTDQRAKVYAIQARYSKQIEDLQRQIDELVAARDEEVDNVLTPEQLEQVNAKRAEAEQRRANRTTKSDDTGS